MDFSFKCIRNVFLKNKFTRRNKMNFIQNMEIFFKIVSACYVYTARKCMTVSNVWIVNESIEL